MNAKLMIGVDTASGALIHIEGRHFMSEELSRLTSEKDRFRDICGHGIDAVMNRTGWVFTARPLCISAYSSADSETPIAAGWCAPILWRDGRRGVNLSYATSSQHTGHRLAKLLTCTAFVLLAEEEPLGATDGVNIQCDALNAPALQVARSMVFEHEPDNDFKVPRLGRQYLAFTRSAASFYQYARATVEHRIGELSAPTPIEMPRARQSA